MNKKTKVGLVLSSAAAILLAGSIMAGGTYALFTSESTNNIVVNSGKVEVAASIDSFTTYTGENLTGVVADDVSNIKKSTDFTVDGATLANGKFMNGGTAELDSESGELTLDKMTPGDKVEFKVKLKNNNNVKAKYRTVIQVIEDDGLYDGLSITIKDSTAESGNTWSNGFSVVSKYSDLEIVESETDLKDLEVTIDFPSDKGNGFQDKKCKIQIGIEAIQSNAATEKWVENALHLYNERDLRKFAKAVNDGDESISEYSTFQLVSDVELEEEWTPIGQKGSSGKKFASIFDGGNHTISGMQVTAATVGRDSDFCLSNPNNADDAITTKNVFDGFGAFFGAIKDATIKNLTVKGSVECDNAGGIVARSYGGTIENCNSNVTVSGIRKAGGIVGMTSDGVTTIKNCNNYGDVDSVVGNNCFTKHTPEKTEHGGDRASAAGIVGFVGSNNETCEISNCTNTGNIGSNDCEFAGGIVGYASAKEGVTAVKVSDSANDGDVSGNTNVGGIIGIVLEKNISYITNCSNSGSVKLPESATTGTTGTICTLNGEAKLYFNDPDGNSEPIKGQKGYNFEDYQD